MAEDVGTGVVGGTIGACAGADAVIGVSGFASGVGGGGMAPLGGPYCSMGRKTGCGAGLLGSLTAYMVASK